MLNIVRASLFKLFRDWTFRITLIIGASLAVFMSLIYYLIDANLSDLSDSAVHVFATGQNMLFTSLQPTQNYGIAVPVNLVIFTIGEYTCGTIRNKIIAGNKKSNIYFGLIFTGLIFTISLMLVYCLVSFGFGSIFGGFNPQGSFAYGTMGKDFLIKMILISVVIYIFITVFSIFIATLIRNIGGAISIVIVSIMFLYVASVISYSAAVAKAVASSSSVVKDYSMYFNPFFIFGSLSVGNETTKVISDDAFIASLLCPSVYSAIFLLLGVKILAIRDIK